MNQHAPADGQQWAAATDEAGFQSLNNGYNTVFRIGRLSVGLVVPIEAYPSSPAPTMSDHLERVQLAERLGFSAVWLRDIPFNVPSFGDAGQPFDPFVYLGYLAAQTRHIALGVASVVLPLRHPAHVAKSAASIDMLSDGRLILGVASGDRPEEYPAFRASYETRDVRFRDSFDYIRQMACNVPEISNNHGRVSGCLEILPKPHAGELPLLVTGSSRQSDQWIAANANGWMVYPRPASEQAQVIEGWNRRVDSVGRVPQPVMQPLYVDLVSDAQAPAQPIPLGLRSGSRALRDHLQALEGAGVNHVALNLRFNRLDIAETLQRLADDLLVDFC